MSETQTTPTEINSPEHDERLKREAQIAKKARAERGAQAAAKREAAKPKAPRRLNRDAEVIPTGQRMDDGRKAPAKPKAAPPQKEGSTAEFVDGLLLQGVTRKSLEDQAKAEAERRGVSTLATPGQITAHIKYRSGQARYTVTETKGMLKMVLVATPAAKPEKAKPAPKTGKPTGRKVEAKQENGRQAVEPVAEPEPTA